MMLPRSYLVETNVKEAVADSRREKPMNRDLYALLILAIGATACWQLDTESQHRQMPRDAPPATPVAVDGPTAVPTAALPSPPPYFTATPGPVPGSTAVSTIPSPTPATTAAPGLRPTPTATSAPKTAPTPRATSGPFSPEDYARHESFMDDFRSISFEVYLEMSDRFTESNGLVAANASGWMMHNGVSQMFARIEMTKPGPRSIEVETLNSFDMYLKDLNEGRWYFIPENTDTGPLEDIMSVPFLALLFGVAPAEELEPVQDGYVWKMADPSWGLITATYDQACILKGITRAGTDGQEILRASFFDLNEPHDVLPHKKGELLPDAYWEQ